VCCAAANVELRVPTVPPAVALLSPALCAGSGCSCAGWVLPLLPRCSAFVLQHHDGAFAHGDTDDLKDVFI
jgi:hypothetical protein